MRERERLRDRQELVARRMWKLGESGATMWPPEIRSTRWTGSSEMDDFQSNRRVLARSLEMGGQALLLAAETQSANQRERECVRDTKKSGEREKKRENIRGNGSERKRE